MEENHSIDPAPPSRRRYRSFFWPIMLISLGILFLVSNLGIVSWSNWNLLWRFWPLILVAAGIDVLFSKRSLFGALLSAFLVLILIGIVAGSVFFAEQLPVFNRYLTASPWETAHVERELEDFETATIFIDWSSPAGSLSALEDSDNLIEGDLTYQGDLYFDFDSQGSNAEVTLDTRATTNWGISTYQNNSRAEWDIALSPEIPLDLSLDTSSGSCNFDLSALMLEDLDLDSGSGSINLSLPEDQSFDFYLDSGSGSVKIELPGNTGIRVIIDSGSGSFNPGSDFQLVSGERSGDGVWESDNYDSAKYTIEMDIDQGSGSITFR